ncbi:hypothetical protein BU23DRAFT_584284 [Bimuria novae-zelandiae CBS 107.79]|uniref:Uncharacterized protein n=1 Tax=Bimuria novae-zelandiae CBS 107.79 TaxID=1447943 RepID=A0A6A5US08_9PLEO|nr:hypothetical protein BU23DRAFT_584284 [Bimuria novae-zelandiae CBS 107.79]
MRLLILLAASAVGLVFDSQPNLGYTELYSLQTQFWDRFLYPNNVKEMESINSTMFSEAIQGRVSDNRKFIGRELNTEYIFGLFTPGDSKSLIGLPVGPYEITQFAATGNIASASTRIQFVFPSFRKISLPVTIDTWLAFNEEKEILQYDSTIRWFDNLLQALLHSIDPDPAKAKVAAKDIIAKSICTTHSKSCSGKNAQYDSELECYRFLTNEVRFGQSFEPGMNTLVCHNVHEIMHIGKTGGGECVDDSTYAQKVEEVIFTNAPWVSHASSGSV